MNDEDDLSGALPPHPPPAPARRETAIVEAMRRFDGGAAPAPVVPPRRSLRTRPQLAGLATAALVVVVALPAAWFALSRGEPHSVVTSDGVASELTAPPNGPVQSAPVRSFDATPPRPLPPPAAVGPSPPALASVSPKQAAVNAPVAAAPPEVAEPVPMVVPPPALREERRAADAMASRAMAKAAPPPPPPPAAQAASPASTRGMSIARRADSDAGVSAKSVAQAEASNSNDVIVTAQRARRSGPGDERADTGALDRAIALDPKSAQAWLNRGLARANAGDSAGALADLDRAVRLAPRSARAHYARGRVLRARGDTPRAQAEFDRAAELDPAFGELDD